MKDENPLLLEVLADEKLNELRSASLDQALGEMRRSRRRHRIIRAAALVAVPLLLMVAVVAPEISRQSEGAKLVATNVPQAAVVTEPPVVENISDEELFALFPNRALALIGPPGRQQLVFLDQPVHN
jgi:hypothetical protein